MLKRSVLHFQASKNSSSQEISTNKEYCIDNRLQGNGGANSLSKFKHLFECFLVLSGSY